MSRIKEGNKSLIGDRVLLHVGISIGNNKLYLAQSNDFKRCPLSARCRERRDYMLEPMS